MAENDDGPSTAEAGGGIPTNTTTTSPTTAALNYSRLREPVSNVDFVYDDYVYPKFAADSWPVKMANVSLPLISKAHTK